MAVPSWPNKLRVKRRFWRRWWLVVWLRKWSLTRLKIMFIIIIEEWIIYNYFCSWCSFPFLTVVLYLLLSWWFRMSASGEYSPSSLCLLAFSSHSYHDDKPLVYRNVDFGVDLETRVALVGPNGAGKSTLLKLIDGEVSNKLYNILTLTDWGYVVSTYRWCDKKT